jgi:hypothetical protein
VSLAAAVEDESKWSGMAARLSAGRRRTEGKRGKRGEGAARTGKEWMPFEGPNLYVVNPNVFLSA